MREGLRSTTVSQRSTVSRRRRDRGSSRGVVKPVSHGGLAGDCNRVRNILPDLNSEANPSESEGGYAGESSEFNGSLAENGVEGLAVDGGIESKGVDIEGEGEIGKDLVHSCSVKEGRCELEVVGELRNSEAMLVDLNVEVLEPDSLVCSNLCASEDGVVLEKDMIRAVDGILQPEMVSNHECDVDTTACSELDVLTEPKVEINDADCNTDAGSGDLQSRSAALAGCSENVMGSADSLGERLDTIGEKRSVPEEDKLQFCSKVLRSRVVGVIGDGQATGYGKRKWATGCQVKATEELRNDESKENLEGQNKKHNCIRGNPREKDKESILLKPVLQGEEPSAEELKIDANNECFDGQNERDNECWKRSNEKDKNTRPLNNLIDKDGAAAEVLNDNISKESVVSPNKKCKVGRGRGRPRKHHNENNAGIPLFEKIEAPSEEGVESCAEELKNAENNECFDGQNERDNECWKSSSKKDESTSPLNNMIDKDGAAAEVLNNNISRESLENPNKKCKVGRGRGRPRKQHNENSSEIPLFEKIEAPSDDVLKIKQEEGNQLMDGTDRQLNHPGRFKRRKRGRPRKIDKENDGNKPIWCNWKRRGKGGAGVKKQDTHQSVECTNSPSGKDQEKNSLNTVLQNDEAASKGESKIKIEGSNELADATNKPKKFRHGWLKKPKRGRPRKINKENDAQESVSQDEEGIEEALVVMRKEDTHQRFEGSVRRIRKQLVEGTLVEMKTRASGTASPSSSSRSKRKRESTDEKASLSESNVSTKRKVKAKSSTREEKKMVRQQIVDMLISAGWTVEYKPRQGKDYADSVYRSPEGKTHWSVTLAYRVLKKQVEMGKATNFCFTPIPEETLSTLFRIQVNTRSDKNKPRQISSSVKLIGKCKRRKKRDHTSDGEEKTADSLFKRKPSPVRSGKQNRRLCALQVRGSGHGSSFAAEDFMAVSGKNSVLSWMIKSGVIPPGGKVHCRRRTRVLEGSITRDGIHCSCCSKLHSVAQFEAHAGNRSCPMYENLYLDNGSSLLQCQLESWNKQEESIHLGFHKVNIDDNDPNDDTCGICGDGGNLICCDGCPSTFHQACLNIQKFPSGDWHCVYCSCKYCGTAGDGVDEDNEKHHKSSSLMTCSLCDGKYHQLCADEKDCVYVQSSGLTFCGKICEQIYEGFQRLVGVRAEVGDGYTCTLIKRPDSSYGLDVLEPKEIENISKLAVALSVMDECFLPIIDHRSGINLMCHTLYNCGSNFKRLNFKGFFTAILEKEDEIICAASIRIHGKELAEMPFIGTRNAYRRKGMCRRLLTGIELALRSLAIEKLVIPAVSEVAETWTSVFGFESLGELGSEMRHMNIIVFPGVDMLQKPLLGPPLAEETTFEPEQKDIEAGDSRSKKQPEENGLIETKVQNGCLSEDFNPTIEALQDADLSSANGSHFPLESAAFDQEEGSKSGLVCSDTVHSSEENKPSTLGKDDRWPGEASDQVVLSSEDPVLEANLTLAEDDACEEVGEPSKSLSTSGGTVFEDHISRLVENGAVDTAQEGCDNIPNNADACSDQRPMDATSQPNSSIDCPKLEVDPINPLENGGAGEEINGSACTATSQTSSELAGEENMSVMDHSIANGAQVTAKMPEHLESDFQIDCKIVAQFNLEKACNMGSGSNDLGTSASFHAAPALNM